MLVGRVYSAIQFNDRSIDTWQVGETLALMGNGYTTRNSIGSLTLVYRDSAPPPLLTPLPPTITLLAAGLAALAARRRPTASLPSQPAR
ncbi:MAG: hypothetical protein J0M16_06100 [Gammaproteobacteria bacterium]|nr:hypothetical protein [Gammaproteobacteria bacterium]